MERRETISIEQFQDMTDQVLQNVKDTESYPAFLNTLENFKRYSVNNIAMIYSQKPHATYIAGYKAWQRDYGRQVKKGAKAIRVMVPDVRKNEGYTHGNLKYWNAGYKRSNVFDVSDTEGQELRETDILDCLQEIDGYESLYKILKEDCGCPVYYQEMKDGRKGIYEKANDRIVIERGLDRKESVDALLETLADRLAQRDTYERADAKAQLIAETILYCARKHYGLEQKENHMNELLGKLSISEIRAVLKESRRAFTEFTEKTDRRLTEYRNRNAIEKADREKEAMTIARDLDAFAYAKDSYKYATNENERNVARQEMGNALAEKEENEIAKMFAYLQHAASENNPFAKKAADLMKVMNAYCKKYAIRTERMKKPEIVFYAAECMEAPGMGVLKENLTLKEAMQEYEKIPSGRMKAGKGVGFELKDGSMYDGKYTLMENGVVRKDAIDIVEHYKNSDLVQKAMKDCRNMIEERKLGKKYVPCANGISKEQCHLAQEFQNRGYDASRMEYRGRVVDMRNTYLYAEDLKDLRYEVQASEINRAEFSNRQWARLEVARKEHADLSVIANPKYSPEQMDQVKSMTILKKNGFLSEAQFQELSDPRMDAEEMDRRTEAAFREYLEGKEEKLGEKRSLLGNLKEKMRYIAEKTEEKKGEQNKEERT